MGKKRLSLFIIIFRALLLFASGCLIEVGTSYIAEIFYNKMPSYIWTIMAVLLFGIYLGIASKYKSIRRLDNDLWEPLAVLMVVVVSFADNFNANWVTQYVLKIWTIDLTVAIIIIVIGLFFVAVDIVIVDRFYDKKSNENIELCLSYNSQDTKETMQNKYTKKMIKTKTVSGFFVFVVLILCVAWATNEILWGV